jgi:hypothetical protein
MDGKVWEKRDTASYELNHVVFDGGIALAAGWNGTILTSSDGLTWDQRHTGSFDHFMSATWTGRQWVAVGTGPIWTSPDGISWTLVESIIGRGQGFLYSVAWSGDLLVAVGDFGPILTAPEDPLSPVKHRTEFRNSISVKTSGGSLIATLPEAFRLQTAEAWVYSIMGRRILGGKIQPDGKQVKMSIRELPRGKYVFMTSDGTQRAAMPFLAPGIPSSD